jgi:hypothetical protein
MNHTTAIDARTARFSEAVRAFKPVCAGRFAKLLPFKERHRGAAA